MYKSLIAVAVTLLVLDLRVPHIDAPVTNAAVWHALGTLSPKLLIFLASFVMIGFFWIGHHLIFWTIERSNRWLMWVNLAFLFPLVCMPFATAFLGDYPSNGVAASVYMADVVLTGLLARATWSYSVRAKLISPALSREYVHSMSRRLAHVMWILVAVAALAPIWPPVSIAAMVAAIAYVVITTGQRAIVDDP